MEGVAMCGLTQHKQIPLNNTNGKDYFVGPIQGDWMMLLDLLDDRGFSYDRDRLFSTGNIIGHGIDSFGATKLLEFDWFYSVHGQQEFWLLVGETDADTRNEHITNQGGQWIKDANYMQLDKITKNIRQKMPLAMTIEQSWGQIGLVHSQAPSNWDLLSKAYLTKQSRLPFFTRNEEFYHARRGSGLVTTGVDFVILGHEQQDRIVQSGNRIWLNGHNKEGFTVLVAEELVSVCAAA